MTVRLWAVLAALGGLAMATVSGCSSKQRKRDQDHRLRHDGQSGPGLGRGLSRRPSRYLAAGQRGRLGRGHRRAVRGQDRDRHRQPADEAQGNRAGQEEHRQGAQGVHRRPRRAGHLRQPATTRWSRSRWTSWPRSTAKAARSRSWKDLGVDNPTCTDGEIIRVSRQNSSGTYAYFHEAVLGEKREYKQGAMSQSGSSDVVALVSKTPCAIGYSGMGYRRRTTSRCSRSRQEKGEPGVEPTLATALDGSYPISRPLYLYTLGEPSGAVQGVHPVDPVGRRAENRREQGYVPVSKKPPAG